MEVQFESTLFIRNLLDSIADLVPAIRLEIRKNGLNVCCMETNGCCIVSMFISEKDMKYKITKETEIMIQLQNLLKKLKEMDKNKPLKMSYKEGGDILYFSQTDANGRNSKHNTKLLTCDEEPKINIPDMKCCAEVNIEPFELTKILKMLLISNEVCKISTIKNKQLIIFSSNGMFDSGREEIPVDKDSITDDYYDYFSIPYFIKFMKASLLCPESVKLCLSKDNPMCIKFCVSNSYIHFYLSPKVKDNEDVAQQGEEGDEIIQDKNDKNGDDSSSEYEDVVVTDSDVDSE